MFKFKTEEHRSSRIFTLFKLHSNQKVAGFCDVATLTLTCQDSEPVLFQSHRSEDQLNNYSAKIFSVCLRQPKVTEMGYFPFHSNCWVKRSLTNARRYLIISMKERLIKLPFCVAGHSHPRHTRGGELLPFWGHRILSVMAGWSEENVRQLPAQYKK